MSNIVFNDKLHIWDIGLNCLMIIGIGKQDLHSEKEYVAMVDLKMDNRFVLASFDKDGRCTNASGRIGFDNASQEFWEMLKSFPIHEYAMTAEGIAGIVNSIRPGQHLGKEHPGVQKIFSKYPWLNKTKPPRQPGELRVGDRVKVINKWSIYSGRTGTINESFSVKTEQGDSLVYRLRFNEIYSVLELDNLMFNSAELKLEI